MGWHCSAVSVGSRREPPPSRWERSLPSGLPSAPSDLPSGGPPIGRQPHPMGGWHLSMGGPTGVSKGARPRPRWEGQREGQRESRREHGAGHDVTILVGSELSEAVSTVVLLPQLRLAAVRVGGSAGVTTVLSDALRSVACGGMWYSTVGWRSEISFVLEELFVTFGP